MVGVAFADAVEDVFVDRPGKDVYAVDVVDPFRAFYLAEQVEVDRGGAHPRAAVFLGFVHGPLPPFFGGCFWRRTHIPLDYRKAPRHNLVVAWY